MEASLILPHICRIQKKVFSFLHYLRIIHTFERLSMQFTLMPSPLNFACDYGASSLLPTTVAAVACVACHLRSRSRRSWGCLQGTIFACKSWLTLALKSCAALDLKTKQLKTKIQQKQHSA